MKCALAILLASNCALAQPGPGELDRSFGAGGLTRWRPGRGQAELERLALAPDGSIVGLGFLYSQQTWSDLAIYRVRPNGRVDRHFGHGGVVTAGLPGSLGWTLAVAPDGAIIGAGAVADDLLLLRLLPDGSRDPSFGNAGAAIVDLGSSDDHPMGIWIEPDGRIVVVGAHILPSNQHTMYVAHFDATGALDPTFAHGGVAIVALLVPARGSPWCVARAPDGSFIVSGPIASASPALVSRIDANGVRDTRFGLQGAAVADIEGGWSVAIDAQGRIVVGGVCSQRGCVARLDRDGHPDRAFGTDGIALAGTDAGAIEAVAILPDGRILAGGQERTPQQDLASVMLFDAAGVLDPSFGTNGTASLRMLGGVAAARTLAFDSAGRLIVGATMQQHVLFARLGL